MKNREKEILRLFKFSGSNLYLNCKQELKLKEEYKLTTVENEKQREK